MIEDPQYSTNFVTREALYRYSLLKFLIPVLLIALLLGFAARDAGLKEIGEAIVDGDDRWLIDVNAHEVALTPSKSACETRLFIFDQTSFGDGCTQQVGIPTLVTAPIITAADVGEWQRQPSGSFDKRPLTFICRYTDS